MKKRLRKKTVKMHDTTLQIEAAQEEALSEKVAAYEDLLKRLKADFDNYKKRTARLHSQASDAGKKTLLSKLLEIYDGIELALSRDDHPSSEVQSFLEGLQLIHKRLEEILKEEGVVPVGAAGEEFDPAVHEAIMVEEAPDETLAGRVARELKRGFMHKDSLLRPAKVVVYGGSKH